MTTPTLVEIMMNDHARLERLLDKLEDHVDADYPMMRKAFNTFEWELEKHVFVEEKAIFTQYSPDDIAEGYQMLPVITKQHTFIVNILDTWRKQVRNNQRLEGFHDFKQFLIKHKKYEENDVYPRLDESLTEGQKRHMIERIQEIV
jgi:hemerythrin superfamily protein